MVDIVQIPVYQESIVVYILLSALIFGFVALALFMLVFFRKDYKEMLIKTMKMEHRMQNFDRSLAGAETIDERFQDIEKEVEKDIKVMEKQAKMVDKEMKDVGVYAKRQTRKLTKKLDKDLKSVKGFVTSTSKKDIDKIKAFMEREEKGLDVEVSDMRDDIKKMEKKMRKEMDKRYKDIALFFLFRIFDDLSAETDEGKINKKLDDFRFFVKFSKRNKYWDKSLEKETMGFLRDMEKRWKSKSSSVSMLYSMFLDEVK